MADATPDTTQDATVAQETAPEVAPQAEERAVVDHAASVSADVPPVTHDHIQGTEPAQVLGPQQPTATESEVDESSLALDHVIVDHNDPLGNKYQFLGQSGPSPLPLAGANGDVRKPEHKLADLIREVKEKL